MLNQTITNTLRVNRRKTKRYEILIKRLIEFNQELREEGLFLMHQNAELILETLERKYNH